jgi:hypothetical protein
VREKAKLRKIADRLNGLNVSTPQGSRWYPASVRASLLRNSPEVYTSLLPAAGIAVTPCENASTSGLGAFSQGGMFMPSDLKEAERCGIYSRA